jgi:hypothetical protein
MRAEDKGPAHVTFSPNLFDDPAAESARGQMTSLVGSRREFSIQ